MKRLVSIVTHAIFLVALVLLGSSDTDISVADTSVPDNKTTISQTEARNSYTIATIIIA